MGQCDNLATKIKQLPRQAGVYLYYNLDGEVIYVGKARVLSKRVRQYFQDKNQDPKTAALVKDIDDLSWIETETELDALLLESELIKRYQPKYNILLRDDKSQIFIKITSHKPIPDITTTRNPVDDGSEYFGPYYAATPIRQALRYLRRVFPFFTTTFNINKRRSLDKDIGLEPKVDSEQEIAKYLQDLQKIKLYLRGERRVLVDDLKKQMQVAASQMNFEQAALLRNQINNLQGLANKIYLRDSDFETNYDPSLIELAKIFGLLQAPRRIEGFDISHMSGVNVVASMVVFINGVSDRVKYRRFKIKIDKNDDFRNMEEVVARRLKPETIAKWGKPDLILIDGGKGQLNAALAEVSKANLKFKPAVIALAEQEEEIIVDLQRSNVGLNIRAIEEIGGSLLTNDHQLAVIRLPKAAHSLKLLQRIRNESHRFAVSYHSLLRKKQQTSSIFDEISGIGEKTKLKLLRQFKTASRIFQASEAELAAVIGPAKAKIIYQLGTHAKNDNLDQK